MTTRAQHIENEVGTAIRALTPQRSAKVLSGDNVDKLRTYLASLLTAHAHTAKAIEHVGALLQAAGADGGGARSVDDLPRTTAATLTDELRRVRTLRRRI